jgi:hypothetical protein
MPAKGYPLASLLGTAILALSLPACAAPPLDPVSRGLMAEETGRPAASLGPPKEQSAPVTENLSASPGAQTLAGLPDPGNGREAGSLDNTHWLWGSGQGTDWLKEHTGEAWNRLPHDIDLCKEDYRNYYTWGTMAGLAAGFAVAAPLANTSADQDVRHWYQKRVRSETTDEWANVMNYAGQFWVAVPVCLEAAALYGKTDENYTNDGGIYEWSNRSLRTMVVGVPPMLLMYAVLGASRPDRNDSRWHPFQDIHGVSGHTYVGAVPFLTAAAMTDDPWLKCPLVLGSFVTGWSRINNDRHYLSQAVLGWWMAYWAVRSVDQTQAGRKSLSVTPILSDGGPGIGIQLRY